MAKVIEFKKPEAVEYETVMKGEAVCHHCGHEWFMVHPVGTLEFACPKCHRNTATFKHGIVQDTFWRCNCGCYLFSISPNEILCWKCGIPVVFGD